MESSSTRRETGSCSKEQPPRKLKAVKSCLVCKISSCKTHLESHLRVSGLQKHKLIDPVKNLQDYICQKHDRPLELFCRDDHTCVCMSCTEVDHKNHNTVPIRESEFQEMMENQRAAQKHNKDIIKDLKKEISEQELMIENQKAAEKQNEDVIKNLKEEITDLEKRNTELEKRNTEQEKRNTELKIRNTELKKRNTELEKRTTELKMRSTELEKRNTELEKRNTELKMRNTELEKRNTELEKRNTELEKRNTELDKRNTELEKRNTELEKRNTELEKRNTELKKRNTELEKRNTELKMRNTEQQQKISNTEDHLLLIQEKHQKHLSHQQKSSSERSFKFWFLVVGVLFVLSACFIQTYHHIQRREAEITELKKRNNELVLEMQRCKAEITELKKKNNELVLEMQRREAEITQLKIKNNEVNLHFRRCEAVLKSKMKDYSSAMCQWITFFTGCGSGP
ncbi:uncharacterized protein LOC130415305 [Triplophysa dalaica]|uniref:uncharacterized protein LOC130415305 n=1 Tax=Triplophysa dalaica TaxID=1582913 RepID=UPI0024DF6205|nr:uncharacterized protein LOC130415305 [Triplophysa dalaica]